MSGELIKRTPREETSKTPRKLPCEDEDRALSEAVEATECQNHQQITKT